MRSLLLGIDFGGTKNAVALTEQGASKWLESRRQESLPNANAENDINAVLEMSRELLSQYSGHLLAIGVSFGGPVDFESGTVKRSYHIPGWEKYALREELENEFDVPVCVDNDANAGALGEWHFGAGVDCESLLYITVSTGIGGGWVLNGKPYRGRDSMAGEIGHIVVNSNGPQCACGKNGCLEALACGPAISRQAISRLKTENNLRSQLRHLCKNDLEQVTAEMVNQAANEGDELAKEVLVEAAHYLGVGIGQALTLMNPDRVVLGGGVSKAGPKYWAEVYRATQVNALTDTTVEIVPAKFQDDAPLWGAIAMANQLLSDQD